MLTAVALHAPVLKIPMEAAGPPEPIIPILIMPRLPPPVAGAAPTPIRLHRRKQRFADDLPIAPLVAPEAPKAATAAQAGPPPGPGPIPPRSNVQRALRMGTAGCANAGAVGLTRAEREHCDEVMGAGARTAGYLGPGLALDKQQGFDRAAAAQRAREGSIPAGVAGGSSDQPWKVK